jgi:colanic acid biosynthesis glycosyl transferase WcaI
MQVAGQATRYGRRLSAATSHEQRQRGDPRGEVRPLRVQLWSYNYAPEPTGIAPVSTVLAEGLRDRGHDVEVVAAHPHYPAAEWGVRRLPYRERRNGIPVLRLPLWIGRASATERYRQELTYMASKLAVLPTLGRPDVVVSASPSFPALLPGIVNTRARKLPWVVWLHDILPDGAAATGLVNEGLVLELARRLEQTAYRQSDLVVVLSRAFIRNLVGKGVPEDKVRLIYDPATRVPKAASGARSTTAPRILSMGNIGFSQGLAPLVAAFESSAAAGETGANLVITGDGVAANDVREKITSGRVEMLGVVDDDRLEDELQRATIALVSQHHEGAEFNIPSKLMNFAAYGLPILAVVNPSGEVARIVREAGAGWVVDSSKPDMFPAKVAELAGRPDEVRERGQAAAAFARERFTQAGFAERFEEALHEAIGRSRAGGGYRTPARADA